MITFLLFVLGRFMDNFLNINQCHQSKSVLRFTLFHNFHSILTALNNREFAHSAIENPKKSAILLDFPEENLFCSKHCGKIIQDQQY